MHSVWRGLCLGAVAVGLLAGWTLDDSPRRQAAATPGQCAPPRALKSTAATKYRSNCMLCALVGEKAIASTYGLTASSPAVLAAGYARRTAALAYRDAVADGCLRGLRLAEAAATSSPLPSPTPGNGNAGGNGVANGSSGATPPGQGASNGKGNAGGR
jgi:hypothetical protein